MTCKSCEKLKEELKDKVLLVTPKGEIRGLKATTYLAEKCKSLKKQLKERDNISNKCILCDNKALFCGTIQEGLNINQKILRIYERTYEKLRKENESLKARLQKIKECLCDECRLTGDTKFKLKDGGNVNARK